MVKPINVEGIGDTYVKWQAHRRKFLHSAAVRRKKKTCCSRIDGMSSTYAKKSDLESAMRFYIGTTQPTDTTVIKRLLEISSEGIWDAGQTRRQGNAIVTDDTAEKSWLWRRSFYDKILDEKRQSADKYDVQCFRCVYGIC